MFSTGSLPGGSVRYILSITVTDLSSAPGYDLISERVPFPHCYNLLTCDTKGIYYFTRQNIAVALGRGFRKHGAVRCCNVLRAALCVCVGCSHICILFKKSARVCSRRVHETPYAPNKNTLSYYVSLHLVSVEKYTACVHILKVLPESSVILYYV